MSGYIKLQVCVVQEDLRQSKWLGSIHFVEKKHLKFEEENNQVNFLI
jgi:hypothetical protein